MKNRTIFFAAFLFLLLSCKSNDIDYISSLKLNYSKNYFLFSSCGRSGYRDEKSIKEQGDLIKSRGNIAIYGEGFFKVTNCVNGRVMFTRNGYITTWTLDLSYDGVRLINNDFSAIYEINSPKQLHRDTIINQIIFTLWKPVGSFTTKDGVYFEFDNYTKANGVVVYDHLEMPVGYIDPYLNVAEKLLNEFMGKNIISDKKISYYLEVLSGLKKNYRNLINGNYFGRDSEKGRILDNIIMDLNLNIAYNWGISKYWLE